MVRCNVTMRHFGTRLKEIRRQSGLAQRAFAERAGIGQNVLVHAEKGKDIRLSTLDKLAVAGGVEIMFVPREIAPAVDALIRAHAAGESLDAALDKPMYTLDEDL